jgi:hypothetical protein
MILGVPKKLVKLISVIMAGSKATVRSDIQYKPAFRIINGVRQGDELSSIFFDLVLDEVFQKMNITGNIGTKSTHIFAYADDVAIVSRNENALKDNLVDIESEARKGGLLINENKTTYVEVTRTVVNCDQLRCGKHEFEHLKNVSYLSSQLNQTNSSKSEIQTRIFRGNLCYYAYGKFMKSGALNRSSKSKIYKSLIRLTVTYGCKAWTLTPFDEQ